MLILCCGVEYVAAQDFPLPLEGEILAYTDADGGAIYLHDTQTQLTRTLQLGSGTHHMWDFSPDGCRVLYTLTDVAQPTQLLSVNLDGSDVRELVDVSELPFGDWSAWEPDWSPTGDRIAFALSRSIEGGRESRVAWVPAEGGAPIFYSVAGDEHTPRWSPDGVWLAYVSYEQRPAGATPFTTAEPNQTANTTLLREADLWMVSADGLTKERLTRFDVGSATNPRWNPAGDLLGFSYSPSPGDNQFWMIAAVADAIPTQLSFEWNQTLDLVWHPDGTTLVAAVRGLQEVEDSRLWTVPLVGNADIDATLYLQQSELGNATTDYPRFNADGTMLALRVDYQMVLLDTDTQAVSYLGSFGNSPPVWSPPGFVGEAAC